MAHHSSADTRVAEPLRGEAESGAASLLLSCRYVARKQGPQKRAGWEAEELSLLPDIGWLGTKARVGGVASYMLKDAKANSFVIMSPTMILDLIRPRQLALHRATRSAVTRAKGGRRQELGCQRAVPALEENGVQWLNRSDWEWGSGVRFMSLGKGFDLAVNSQEPGCPGPRLLLLTSVSQLFTP